MNVLTGLVFAAGTASQEDRDVVDGVDLRVAGIAERHDEAVVEQRATAFLDRVHLD